MFDQTKHAIDWARWYLERGLTPIPCLPKNKLPACEWKQYQFEQPTADQITQWWKDFPNANVGIVTNNDLAVLDFDSIDNDIRTELLKLTPTPLVETGKGLHIYFQPTRALSNRAGLIFRNKYKVDIRANGGYVIAPPSVHPNGQQYRWLTELTLPAPLLPAEFSKLFQYEASPHNPMPQNGAHWVSQLLGGVPQGSRNQSATRLAGYLLKHHAPDMVLLLLTPFAERCTPPLPLKELQTIIQSVHQTHQRKTTDQYQIRHVSSALGEAIRELKDPQKYHRQIETPFRQLNRLTNGGFKYGELIYLGGFPGVGKTTLALDIARHAAKGGHEVLIISQEMRSADLSNRLLSQSGGAPANEIRAGTINDWGLVQSAHDDLSKLPLYFCDELRHINDLESILATKPSISLVVVDYLQLLSIEHSGGEARFRIEAISKFLRNLSKHQQKVILCISSLSRTQENQRPTIHQFKESSNLGHDCDIGIIVYTARDHDIWLEIVKSRNSNIGKFRLRLLPDLVGFREIEHGERLN